MLRADKEFGRDGNICGLRSASRLRQIGTMPGHFRTKGTLMDLENSHHHDAAMADEVIISDAKKPPSQHDHHAHMVEDFRKRFWISLALTLPIVILSPMIQEFVGLETKLRFPRDQYLLWAFSSVVFFYGGWPFLKGIVQELKNKKPEYLYDATRTHFMNSS